MSINRKAATAGHITKLTIYYIKTRLKEGLWAILLTDTDK